MLLYDSISVQVCSICVQNPSLNIHLDCQNIYLFKFQAYIGLNYMISTLKQL